MYEEKDCYIEKGQGQTGNNIGYTKEGGGNCMNEDQLVYLQNLLRGSFTQVEPIQVEVYEKVDGELYFYEVRPQGDGRLLPYRLLDKGKNEVQGWSAWESVEEIAEAFRRNSF